MIYYIIVFILITTIYIKVCVSKRNLLNILVYGYWTYALQMVFLYIFRLAALKEYYTLSKGDLILIIYFTLYFIGAYYIEINSKPLKVKELTLKKPSNFAISICTLVLLFYWLKNINVLKKAIINPRMFYANARLGGGMIYFVIIPISIFLYYILISRIKYNSKRILPIIKIILISLIFFVYLYIFGRKANMVKIILVFLFTLYYANHGRNLHINKDIIKYIILSGFVLIMIFGLYFKQQNMSTDRIFLQFVNYSDYLKNFSELMKYLPHHFWGKLFIESEFYSFIPRFLWKAKPELFGSLTLGLYVPSLRDWTLSMTGAPSFGPLGQEYADFGLMGVPIKLFVEWFLLLVAKSYECKLENGEYNFFYQWLMMSFCGVRIFTITLTTFPIYEVIIVFLIYNVSKIKINVRK